MRVIIVDDEMTSSDVMRSMLKTYLPKLEVVAVCNKAKDAIDKISGLKPDLVFLDIELPEMSGFDILEKIDNIDFDVIFTTAHNQYGIKAIQYSAIDYLLKPIQPEELLSAVQRVVEHKTKYKPLEKIRLLLENVQLMNNNTALSKIALPTQDGLKFVSPDDIIRCSSSSNYTTIYLKSNEKILLSKTLKEIESLLSASNFCRVHNSHLININHVSKMIKGDTNIVVMQDNTEVEVSRRKRDDLIKLFNL